MANNVKNKISHEEAFSACIDINTQSGFWDLGVVKLDNYRSLFCVVYAVALLVSFFFPIPNVLVNMSIGGLFIIMLWAAEPTYKDSLEKSKNRARDMNGDNRVNQLKKKRMMKNFYED